MQRADEGLAFLLRYENIAWYENGCVRILDRRVYPTRVEFVHCYAHQEVAQAVKDMVTQSAGPYTAAAMGMALAAYECKDMPHMQQAAYLEQAAQTISHARPTTTARMLLITAGCLHAANAALQSGANVPDAIVAHAIRMNNARYEKIGRMADYLVDMIPQSGSVLTQCFGETIVGQLLKTARSRNSALRVFCAETRPYFQGARLTASVAQDMGFETTIVTDNMPAYLMQKERIDIFTSAADVICEDGHVVNKIGTFQIAIVAKYMGVPYFATGAPDRGHPDVNSVHIEMRDPDFVLQAMGVRTAMQGVRGYYPSFDVTPPHLISGIVTDCGTFSPYDLARYYRTGNRGEYDILV